jgi:hypothetical protein
MTDDNGVPIDRDADGTNDGNDDYVEIPGEVETERDRDRGLEREPEFEGDGLTWAERPLIESGDDLDSGGWSHPLV